MTVPFNYPDLGNVLGTATIQASRLTSTPTMITALLL